MTVKDDIKKAQQIIKNAENFISQVFSQNFECQECGEFFPNDSVEKTIICGNGCCVEKFCKVCTSNTDNHIRCTE